MEVSELKGAIDALAVRSTHYVCSRQAGQDDRVEIAVHSATLRTGSVRFGLAMTREGGFRSQNSED